MKKITASLATAVALSNFGYAGGDIILGEIRELEMNGFYAGGAIHAVSLRDAEAVRNIFDIEDGQDRVGNGSFVLGYELLDFLDIEGRYGQTFQDEDIGTTNYVWSLFLKPKIKFQDEEDIKNGDNFFSVYGLLGYGGIEVEAIEEYQSVQYDKGTEKGFQWGFGLSYTLRDYSDEPGYKFEDTWTVFIDYTNYAPGGMYVVSDSQSIEIEADSLNVGVVYNFFSFD